MKYFYIDSEGNKKRYRGKVNNVDNSLIGTIVYRKQDKYVAELTKESDSIVEDKEVAYLVWKDKYGNENKLSGTENIKDNKVIHEYKEEFEITFTPPVEGKDYFTIKGKNDIYKGEVKEVNGKFFGEI